MSQEEPKPAWIPILIGSFCGALIGAVIMMILGGLEIPISGAIVVGPCAGMGAVVGMNIAARQRS